MSAVQDLFQQAQLAEAAYADFARFGTNVRGALQDASRNMTFSDAQATAFINTWQVIDHIPDTASDFSATIFRNIQTGAYSLAIRGSTSLTDFAADAALIVLDGTAVRQVVDLYNFWQRSTTRAGLTYVAAQVVPYFSPLTPSNAIRVGGSAYGIVFTNSSELADVTLRTATGVIPAGLGTINIVGHSLGGHLTMAFTRLFPALTTDALGINGLGFKLGNSTVDSLFSILGGVGANAFTYSKIQNIYGIAGPEFAAMNNFVLQQPGDFKGIYIESASPLLPIVGGHGAAQMTDSAALYSVYAKFAPNLTLEQITTLLKSASPIADRTLESALDALRIVLQGKTLAETNPTKYEGTDARDSLYRNIKALQDSAAYSALSGSAALRLSAQENADSLAQKAKNDFGWFLAVQELLPIAIEGGGSALIGANPDLYGRWSADRVKRIDGSSDLEFTNTYIADRAKMLAWWMVGNADDRGYGPTTGGENWQFLDVASGKAAYALSTASAIDQANTMAGDPKRLASMFDAEMKRDLGHRVGFGGDIGDQITGGSLDDRLYGMAGDDMLQGRGGNDLIEGGKDDDVLIGGKGDDSLNGGQGYDSYVWNTGDGNDVAIDSDRRGRIVINGSGLKLLVKQTPATWTTPDGKVTLTQGDTWKLTINGGGSLDLGASFTDGDYGIWRTESAAGGTLLRGDLKPIDFDITTPEENIHVDSFGNVEVTTTEVPGR
ncbi:MAG: outer membrane adhesin-like protein, partial [Rhodocyclaceae bacterium]